VSNSECEEDLSARAILAVMFATKDKHAASSEPATSLASELIEQPLQKRTDPGFIEVAGSSTAT
jgi:hypothetical protein